MARYSTGATAPLLRREVDVARGHREPVALPHGARADHLDAEVEIARPSASPPATAENPSRRRSRNPAGHCVNSLPTTVATPPKKCGRKRSSSPAMAGPSGTMRVAKPSGYIALTSGIPDQVDVLGGELGDIGLPGARIGTEIFGRRELGRVDEDRDDDFSGAAFGQPDQRHMAVMERSHGRHQRDRGLSGAKAVEGAAQCGDRADDHGTSRHLDSISRGRIGGGRSTSAAGGLTLTSGDLIKARPRIRHAAQHAAQHEQCRAHCALDHRRERRARQFMIKADRQRFEVSIAHFT